MAQKIDYRFWCAGKSLPVWWQIQGHSNELQSNKGSTVFMALRGEAVPEPAGAGPTDCKQSVTAAPAPGLIMLHWQLRSQIWEGTAHGIALHTPQLQPDFDSLEFDIFETYMLICSGLSGWCRCVISCSWRTSHSATPRRMGGADAAYATIPHTGKSVNVTSNSGGESEFMSCKRFEKSESASDIFCLYEFQINVGLYISHLLVAVAKRGL